MAPETFEVRALAVRDSFEKLTKLLHAAYAPLAAQGMNFTAATQTATDTARRASQGQCFVALQRGKLVGTVTVSGPYDDVTGAWTATAEIFREPNTAHFHQFAVQPELQGKGLGRLLITSCEDWAKERHFKSMALDTAEPAAALRALYRRLGYRECGHVQWPDKAYRSVLMRKPLFRSPLRGQLQAMAAYHQWATARLIGALAAWSDAVYAADGAGRKVHSALNRWLAGEEGLWWPRIAAGESPMLDPEAEFESDRQALCERLLTRSAAWSTQIECRSDEQLHGMLSFDRVTGEPVDLPLASLLLHVFNRATELRGEVRARLQDAGVAVPPLDLVWMVYEEATANE